MKIFLNIEFHEGDEARMEGLLAALGGDAVATTITYAGPTSGEKQEPEKVAPAKEEDKPATKATRGKKAAAEPKAPAKEPEETKAQDAEDEAAEAAGNESDAGESGKLYTADDLRKAMGEYNAKHGMAATQEDGVKIFSAALKDFKLPEGATGWKVSVVASVSDEAIHTAAAAWIEAAAGDARFAG